MTAQTGTQKIHSRFHKTIFEEHNNFKNPSTAKQQAKQVHTISKQNNKTKQHNQLKQAKEVKHQRQNHATVEFHQ